MPTFANQRYYSSQKVLLDSLSSHHWIQQLHIATVWLNDHVQEPVLTQQAPVVGSGNEIQRRRLNGRATSSLLRWSSLLEQKNGEHLQWYWLIHVLYLSWCCGYWSMLTYNMKSHSLCWRLQPHGSLREYMVRLDRIDVITNDYTWISYNLLTFVLYHRVLKQITCTIA